MATNVLKSPSEGLEKKFLLLCQEVVTRESLVLYDLEWIPKSAELKVYIMNPETKSALLEDCIRVDRALSPYIDELEWMPEELTLEVSSPGMYRQLNRIEHFQWAVGEDALLTLNREIEPSQCPDLPNAMKKNMKPKVKILSAKEDEVQVAIKDSIFFIPYTQIKKAQLEMEILKKNQD